MEVRTILLLICLIPVIYFIFYYDTIWSFSYFTQTTSLITSNNYNKTIPELYTKDHEIARRQLDETLYNLYYYLSDQVKTHKENKELQIFGSQAIDITFSLLAQSANFGSTIDNAEKWHRLELRKISDFIIKRIHESQNPRNCDEAKILICEFSTFMCGFGCLVHRIALCLNIAVASNRTMIINHDGKGWKYSKNQTWDSFFKPVSNCTYENVVKNETLIVKYTHINQTDKIVLLRRYFKRPEQVPLSFPKQLADKLLTHHSNPAGYFGAHFVWYVSQNNEQMQNISDKFISKINLNKSPIVGIHIRRTDKLELESDYISIDKYFEWAEFWFQLQEKRNPSKTKLKRRVFIATEDPSAIEEAKEKYPNYEILADMDIANNFEKNRYTEDFLKSVITNQQALIKCDFVVCTFSSNVCNFVYDWIQVENGDADKKVYSLDIAYKAFFRWHDRNFVAVENHIAKDSSELSFKIGDLIGVEKYEGNQKNGFSTGFIRKGPNQNILKDSNNTYEKLDTREKFRFVANEGKYPSHKTREVWRIVDFPMFNP